MQFLVSTAVLKTSCMAGILASALLLPGTLLAASESIVEKTIAERQDGFKKMGKAMKAFRNQLRSDTPDTLALVPEAEILVLYSQQMAGWFPAGSGPESGVDTDALPYIWKNTAKFDKLVSSFEPAASSLLRAAKGADLDGIKKSLFAVKDICSDCHDSFRAD